MIIFFFLAGLIFIVIIIEDLIDTHLRVDGRFYAVQKESTCINKIRVVDDIIFPFFFSSIYKQINIYRYARKLNKLESNLMKHNRTLVMLKNKVKVDYISFFLESISYCCLSISIDSHAILYILYTSTKKK